jgi:hypothetical protein
MLNPDGVVNGHHRTSLAGHDMNRVWSTPDPDTTPEIWAARTLILGLQARAAALGALATRGAAPPAAAALVSAGSEGEAAAHSPEGGAAAAPPPPPPPAGRLVLPILPQPVLMFCDFHGHSKRRNAFTFGCAELVPDGEVPIPGEAPSSAAMAGGAGGAGSGVTGRLFPALLASRAGSFSFTGCGWSVSKDKLGCARVFGWRDALLPAA